MTNKNEQLKRIDELLATCGKDGWLDGDGVGITETVAAKARLLVEAWPESVGFGDVGIFPYDTGELAFEVFVMEHLAVTVSADHYKVEHYFPVGRDENDIVEYSDYEEICPSPEYAAKLMEKCLEKSDQFIADVGDRADQHFDHVHD